MEKSKNLNIISSVNLFRRSSIQFHERVNGEGDDGGPGFVGEGGEGDVEKLGGAVVVDPSLELGGVVVVDPSLDLVAGFEVKVDLGAGVVEVGGGDCGLVAGELLMCAVVVRGFGGVGRCQRSPTTSSRLVIPSSLHQQAAGQADDADPPPQSFRTDIRVHHRLPDSSPLRPPPVAPWVSPTSAFCPRPTSVASPSATEVSRSNSALITVLRPAMTSILRPCSSASTSGAVTDRSFSHIPRSYLTPRPVRAART
ncbi:uncharacterized protein A4U43_C07F25560 [Asparagus officinalis]|uniref:Uncharacterized protein n=1 Tax=Asparagus officinalis TaxID=4686 RepID=A0A5P1EGS9_ASPOF|nr:uncharacterized protein A4U43_C07F25560 [Asparagus officinalis]